MDRYERLSISKPGPGLIRENPAVPDVVREGSAVETFEVGLINSQETMALIPIRTSSRPKVRLVIRLEGEKETGTT